MQLSIARQLRLLPAIALAAALLGGIYNYAFFAFFHGAAFFQLLSYLDHINSAALAFGLILLGALIVQTAWVLVAALAGAVLRKPVRQPTGRFLLALGSNIGLVCIGLGLVLILGFFYARAGLLQRGVVPWDLFIALSVICAVYLRRFLLSADWTALLLFLFFSCTMAFAAGLLYAASLNARSWSTAVVELAQGSIEAKGVRPFSTFSFVIGKDDEFHAIRTDAIRQVRWRAAPMQFEIVNPYR